jgi:hypothetical protein
VSLETFDTVDSLTLRLIPGLPESAIPELELDFHQRPFSWYFTLFFIAANSCWLGFSISLIESDVWKKRTLLITVALYVTIWPVADIVARRQAPRNMKRQETTKDFTWPFPGAVPRYGWRLIAGRSTQGCRFRLDYEPQLKYAPRRVSFDLSCLCF